MAELDNNDLQARIERLEKKVALLEQKLKSERSGDQKLKAKQKTETSQKPSSVQEEQHRSDTSRLETANVELGEEWLNRIGIGLLLVGVAFLFKYSIDQGWLIPPVRSAIGLGIGMVLFGAGLRMAEEMKPLKQILLGGGIAAFYITGFATFQFYAFLPAAVVWTFMVVVTLLSLSLSLQQDEAILSVVGTLGAFGTPFMLYSGGGSVVLLMCYTALVMAGTIAVYMNKGWKSLLWSISLGGALVIFVGIVNTTYDSEPASHFEHWSLQMGALFWLTCAWLLPVYREILSSNNLARWPNPDMLLEDGTIDKNMPYHTSSTAHLMVFIVPLLMLVMTIGLWDLSMNHAGLVSMGLAVVGAGFYLLLKDRSLPTLGATNGFLALSMLTIGFVLMLEGNFLFIVLSVEAVALRFIANQTGDTRLGISSHLLFGFVLLWVINSLYYSLGMPSSVGSIESLTQLLAIVAGGILIPRWLEKSDAAQVYQTTSHLLFLFWLYQKLSVGGNGQAWVTISWAAYAIGLLVFGFVRYRKKVRLVAMATIFLVVGKLFLIDLSKLEAIWRILIFMTFGAVFLMLGYYWQSRWSDGEVESDVSNQ